METVELSFSSIMVLSMPLILLMVICFIIGFKLGKKQRHKKLYVGGLDAYDKNGYDSSKWFSYQDMINNKPPSITLLSNYLIESKGLIVKPDPKHISKVEVYGQGGNYLFKDFGSFISDRIVDYYKVSPSNYIVKNGKVIPK